MGTHFQNTSLIRDTEKKLLIKQKWSKLFPAATVFLALALVIFVLAIFKIGFGFEFAVLSFFALFTGIIIFILLTRKINEDLKNGRVNLIEKLVEDKVYKIDYEPGSASMPGNLFSNSEMRELHIYYVVLDGEKIYINKDDFEKAEINKPIFVRQTQIAKVFLGLQKV